MPARTLHLSLQHAYPDFALQVEEQLALEGITALFGPSGGGKTTLLRLIAGFERGTGRIAFEDEAWADSGTGLFLPPHARPVGSLFQEARLFSHLSVEGNLRYAARRSGAEGEALYRDVVSALDLTALLERRVGTLSGGERQRAALGRTLLARPKLLLLDEPFSALDQARKTEILPFLEEIPRRFRIPAILVSHSVEEVALLAQETLVLAAGRVEARGPTGRILERLDLEPLTGRFEAGVVAEARIADGDAGHGLARLELDGQSLWVPGRAGLRQGAGVRVRIRARDVALATEKPQAISIQNILAGTVQEIAADGTTPFAEVLVDLGTARLRARITQKSAAELSLAPGMAVFALVKAVTFDGGG